MIQTGRFRNPNGTIAEDRVEAAKAYLNTDWDKFYQSRLKHPGFDPEHVEKIIEDCLHALEQKQFDERKRLADESGDIALLDSLLKEKRKMIKRICL